MTAVWMVACLCTLAGLPASAQPFRFSDVRPGTYALRARHVGFEVVTQEVTVDATRAPSPTVDIFMRTGARVLAEITISGQRVVFPAHLAGPYTRVARGNGAFARVAGVRVND